MLFFSVLISVLPALQFYSPHRRLAVKLFLLKWITLSVLTASIGYILLPAYAGFALGRDGWGLMLLLLGANAGLHLHKGLRPVLITAAVVVLYGVFHLSSFAIFRSGDLSENIGEVDRKEWTHSMPAVDPKHIRLVSEEQARWIGAKALGDGLGSVYHPGPYSLQKIGDHLYWVAALDFQGFRRWMTNESTPGAIVVDGQDPTAPARLVRTDASGKEIKLRFTPDAFFNRKLARHVWLAGYSRYKLQGYHLEFDDDFRPFWVVTALKPTIGFTGDKPVKTLVVDPESGEIREYSLDEVPAWVDRVIPQEVVVKNISWWGMYRKGWWASFIGAQGLVEPTALDGASAWLVYGPDGRCSWYSGLTSPSDKDDTLLGFTLTDSRTGKTTEYSVSGMTAGTANAASVAAAAKVANFRGWHPTQPIPYNIYGTLAYVIPIVNENHLFQEVAIVDVSCQRVALASDTTSALIEFKQMLSGASGNGASPTLDASTKTLNFQVERKSESVRNGNSTVYLYTSKHPGRTFFGTSQQGHQLFLTREGDTVTVKFLDTEESLIPIQEIENSALNKR